MTFLPDKKQMLVEEGRGPVVRLFNAESGEEVRTFCGNGGLSCPVALSQDAQLLAMGASDGTAMVWEVATGKERFKIQEAESAPCNAVAISPDNKIIVTGFMDAHFWDATTGKLLHSLPSRGSFRIPGVGADGQALRPRPLGQLGSLSFSPDGKQLVSLQGPWVVLWDPATGKEARRIANDDAKSVHFLSDGKNLLVTDSTAFQFLDAATAQPVRISEGHKHPLDALVWCPDGKHLATAAAGEGICIWDIDTHRVVLQCDGRRDWAAMHLATVPRSDLLVASTRHTLAAWDSKTGAQRLVLPLPGTEPLSLLRARTVQ